MKLKNIFKNIGWELVNTKINKKLGFIEEQTFRSKKYGKSFKIVHYLADGTIKSERHVEYSNKVLQNTVGRFPNNDKYGTYHTTYKCPNCGCTIHLDWHEHKNYCPECGVKLDWTAIKKEN